MTSAANAIEEIEAAASLGIDDISELLVSVNEVTQRLQATHETLREQVASLQEELAAANEQLRRSKSLAALGEMAAGIAHEIRNPLGSILLYVQMLETDLADKPDMAATCGKIGQAVRRLDAIVKDVMTFANDRRVKPEPVDVAMLFDACVVTCENLARVHGVEVRREIEPDASHVGGDSTLLIQAISNLLRNGIEAAAEMSAEDRQVTLRSALRQTRDANGARCERNLIIVEDTGPGIPGDLVSRMFNPFFTTRATGTGLGLAIVHRIVDAHGGEVHVQNREPSGARIELRLPTNVVANHVTSNRQVELKTHVSSSTGIVSTSQSMERIQ